MDNLSIYGWQGQGQPFCGNCQEGTRGIFGQCTCLPSDATTFDSINSHPADSLKISVSHFFRVLCVQGVDEYIHINEAQLNDKISHSY